MTKWTSRGKSALILPSPPEIALKILAHRGWWLEPAEKNSRLAFERSFKAGYGVETDVRDLDGALVISHDMPKGPGLMGFGEFLDLYTGLGAPGELALNVKADGLHAPVHAALKDRGLSNAFVFDMAVPDAIGYLARGIETYTRHSEMEPTPPFYAKAQGVWMDCFDGDWIGEADIRKHLSAGKKVALVSPELHKRPHATAWAAWRGLAGAPGLSLCTDFPGEAEAYFGRNRL